MRVLISNELHYVAGGEAGDGDGTCGVDGGDCGSTAGPAPGECETPAEGPTVCNLGNVSVTGHAEPTGELCGALGTLSGLSASAVTGGILALPIVGIPAVVATVAAAAVGAAVGIAVNHACTVNTSPPPHHSGPPTQQP